MQKKNQRTCCLITLLQRSINGSGSGSRPPEIGCFFISDKYKIKYKIQNTYKLFRHIQDEYCKLTSLQPTQVFHCDFAVAPYRRDNWVNLGHHNFHHQSHHHGHLEKWPHTTSSSGSPASSLSQSFKWPFFHGVRDAPLQEIVPRRKRRGFPPPCQGQLVVMVIVKDNWWWWWLSRTTVGVVMSSLSSWSSSSSWSWLPSWTLLTTHWGICPAQQMSRRRPGCEDKFRQTGFCWGTKCFTFLILITGWYLKMKKGWEGFWGGRGDGYSWRLGVVSAFVKDCLAQFFLGT